MHSYTYTRRVEEEVVITDIVSPEVDAELQVVRAVAVGVVVDELVLTQNHQRAASTFPYDVITSSPVQFTGFNLLHDFPQGRNITWNSAK
jgi:hypothetical protein